MRALTVHWTHHLLTPITWHFIFILLFLALSFGSSFIEYDSSTFEVSEVTGIPVFLGFFPSISSVIYSLYSTATQNPLRWGLALV